MPNRRRRDFDWLPVSDSARTNADPFGDTSSVREMESSDDAGSGKPRTEHRTPRSPPGRTCETTIDPSDAEVQKNASGASGSGVDGTPGMPGAAEVETGVGLAEGLGVGLGVTAEVLAEGLAGTTATVDALGVGVAGPRA